MRKKKQRGYTRIDEAELDRVAELTAQGSGVRAIARTLGRAPSSISALIAVNADRRGGGSTFRAALATLPKHLRRTMTHDNGKEIAKGYDLKEKLGLRVYVAHPRSPWERGTNENTNGLVREFFPKGTDFRAVTDEEVQYVQELINDRPRKTLDWCTPNEKMSVSVRLAS